MSRNLKRALRRALLEIDDEQCCVRPLIRSTQRCGCARFWSSTRRHGRRTFLRAPRGASILALTARQVGKTTTAAWAIAHTMLFTPGSLSVIACPAQRQSAEAVRRVREALIKAGAELESDNVYGLELENGSRVLALPGSDDSIRGLTVDGWIVADEAARLISDLIAALRPMRARRPQARFAMLSTAWSRSRSLLDGLGGRRPDLDPAQSDRRQRPITVCSGISGARAACAG